MSRRKKLLKFPREFRKKTRNSFDRDFLIILLLCLFFHFFTIHVLLRYIPTRFPLQAMTRLQGQYATTLLNRTQGTIQISSAQMLKVKAVGLLAVERGAGSGGKAGGGEGGSGAGSGGLGSGYGNREAGLPTMGELSIRRGGGSGRGKSMSDMANEMSDMGFLGVLTSGSGYVPGEYIEGISDLGNIESSRLGTALSSLDALSVSKKRGGSGSGSGEGGEDDIGFGKARRGSGRKTKTVDVEDLLTNVQGTGKVEFKNIKRTQQSFVQVSQNIQPKPPVPLTPEEKALLRRKPDFVQAIIDRHRLAITDCYKQLLKIDPALKGKIEVRISIDPEGRVSGAEIISSTFNDATFTECIIAKIKNWNDFGYADPTAPDEVYRQVYTFGY